MLFFCFLSPSLSLCNVTFRTEAARGLVVCYAVRALRRLCLHCSVIRIKAKTFIIKRFVLTRKWKSEINLELKWVDFVSLCAFHYSYCTTQTRTGDKRSCDKHPEIMQLGAWLNNSNRFNSITPQQTDIRSHLSHANDIFSLLSYIYISMPFPSIGHRLRERERKVVVSVW